MISSSLAQVLRNKRGSVSSIACSIRNLSGSAFDQLLVATQGRADDISNRYIKKDHLDLDVWKKRLVYRSKQRGWLEVDLLLGTYASEKVPTMRSDELEQFEDFINLETIDIYNIMTLRTDIPDHMKKSDGQGIAEHIQQWVMSKPLGTADPQKYKEVKEQNNLI